MGDKRNAYRVLVGKRNGKRPITIPTDGRGSEMSSQEAEWEGVEGMDMAEGRGLL
jgi:hypothetical protein